MATLDVLAEGRRVGILASQGTGMAFAYDPAWRQQPGCQLSQSMPLRDEVFQGTVVEAFFGGLLPEGDSRTAIERALQISRGNDFHLLSALGGDCAGALTLWPPGTSLPGTDDSPASRPLKQQQLEDMVAGLDIRPLGAGEKGWRISIAGAQRKLVLARSPGGWYAPTPQLPSTSLLKPPIHAPGIADSVLNELFCMRLARRVDLPVPECWRLPVPECYVVERYDRQRTPDGHTRRVHQEDFCQALGVPSQRKYESEGGPGLVACFALVRRASRQKARDQLNLLRWAIFNFVIGNHDAHGKNLSLLYDQPGPEQPVLAPFYDLLSTAIYPQLSQRMAMRIGSQPELRYLAWRHWLELAAEAGLRRQLMESELRRWPGRIHTAATRMAAEPSFAGNPTVAAIVALIAARRDKLARLDAAHQQADSAPPPEPIQ